MRDPKATLWALPDRESGPVPVRHLHAERGIELRALGPQLLVGRCPFEAEPLGLALLVEPAGRFRCLACRARGGNVVGFVMQLDRLTLLGALELLAQRAGLDLAAVMQPPASPARSSGAGSATVAMASRRTPIHRGFPTPLWALTPPVWEV